MGDLIDGGEVAGIIASSTTNYIIQFAPIFYLLGGLLIALIVIEYLIEMIRPKQISDNQKV